MGQIHALRKAPVAQTTTSHLFHRSKGKRGEGGFCSSKQRGVGSAGGTQCPSAHSITGQHKAGKCCWMVEPPFFLRSCRGFVLRVPALRTQEAARLFLNHDFLISVFSQPCFKAGSRSIWGPGSIFQQEKKKKKARKQESKQTHHPFPPPPVFPKTSEA